MMMGDGREEEAEIVILTQNFFNNCCFLFLFLDGMREKIILYMTYYVYIGITFILTKNKKKEKDVLLLNSLPHQIFCYY